MKIRHSRVGSYMNTEAHNKYDTPDELGTTWCERNGDEQNYSMMYLA